MSVVEILGNPLQDMSVVECRVQLTFHLNSCLLKVTTFEMLRHLDVIQEK